MSPPSRPEDESAVGSVLDDVAFVEVMDAYAAGLVVPPPRPGPLFLLCPVGLVGAGKTTVVKPLAERLGLVRISGDEIRKLLREKGFNNLRTGEVVFALVLRFAKAGRSVVIDADCAGAEVGEMVRRLAGAASAKVVWIHIAPPEAFIRAKLTAFKHSWLFKDADDALANYERRKPLHVSLDQPFVFTFDPSRDDLPGQLEKGERAIVAAVEATAS